MNFHHVMARPLLVFHSKQENIRNSIRVCPLFAFKLYLAIQEYWLQILKKFFFFLLNTMSPQDVGDHCYPQFTFLKTYLHTVNHDSCPGMLFIHLKKFFITSKAIKQLR